jgi:hypothetical protein
MRKRIFFFSRYSIRIKAMGRIRIYFTDKMIKTLKIFRNRNIQKIQRQL